MPLSQHFQVPRDVTHPWTTRTTFGQGGITESCHAPRSLARSGLSGECRSLTAAGEPEGAGWARPVADQVLNVPHIRYKNCGSESILPELGHRCFPDWKHHLLFKPTIYRR